MTRGAALLAAITVLAACSGDEQAGTAVAGEGAELIECAVGGAKALERVCAVERVPDETMLTYTVRHPDGSFRRFGVADGGVSLFTLDGADEAVVTAGEASLTVAVGADRYVFPAKARTDAAAD